MTPDPAMLKGVEWALQNGWAVIPLTPGTKSPAFKTGEGHEHALVTEDEVVAWLMKRPSTEAFAVRTGLGLVVLDVDDPDALAELPFGLPYTLTVATGRQGGGRHLYFIDLQRDMRSFDPVPGLEIKAWGKYVVLPGSKHPNGTTYRAVNEGEAPSLMPEWFRSLQPERPDYAGDDQERYGPGERRARLVHEAARLRNTIGDYEVLRAALWAFNDSRFDPPFRDDVEPWHDDFCDIDRLAKDFMAKSGYDGPITVVVQ